jgi:hypothetical protein
MSKNLFLECGVHHYTLYFRASVFIQASSSYYGNQKLLSNIPRDRISSSRRYAKNLYCRKRSASAVKQGSARYANHIVKS